MSNIVLFEKSTELTAKKLATAIAAASTELTTSVGAPFLKLTRAGAWVYGQEGVAVEKGSLWAINPQSLQHGWISWGEGEVLGEKMVPISTPRPAQEDLPPSAEKWDEQVGVQLCCIKGTDKGQNVIYKTNSLGGKNAFQKYFDALGNQLKEDESKVVAVCELDCSSYQHKKYGEIFTPYINIQHWTDMDGKK